MESSENTEILQGEKVKELDKLFSIGLFDDYKKNKKDKEDKEDKEEDKENFLKGGEIHTNQFIGIQEQILYSPYNTSINPIQETPDDRFFAGLLTTRPIRNIDINIYRDWSYVITSHDQPDRPDIIHIHFDYNSTNKVHFPEPYLINLGRNRELKLTYQLGYDINFTHLKPPAPLRVPRFVN